MKFAALFLLLTLSVAAKTSFQGTFKLDVSKSDFGQFPPPSSLVQEVTHEDPSFKYLSKMSSDRGDFEFTFTCTTDGKECTNDLGPNSMKNTVRWEGDALVLEGKGYFGDSEVTMTDKWELSADGKTLTINRKWSSTRGDLVQKLILDKQ